MVSQLFAGDDSAHDKFSFSFICSLSLAGSTKYYCQKVPDGGGQVFTCGFIASAQPLSNPLQEGIRLFHPLCSMIPDALRLRFYPGYLLEIDGREHRASMFRIDNIMRI